MDTNERSRPFADLVLGSLPFFGRVGSRRLARNARHRTGAGGERPRSILRDIESASQVNDPGSLERLKAGIEAQVDSIDRDTAMPEQVKAFIRANTVGSGNLFAVRERHFRLAERKSFLVI